MITMTFTISDPLNSKPDKNKNPEKADSFRKNLQDMNVILSCYNSVSLSEMEGAALMDRCEEKYILTGDEAVDVLRTLPADYYVLEIEGSRYMGYETCYFDTDEYDTYLQHHNGKLNRYKIRSRRYEVTNESFFEVKQKSNTGRSNKKRISTERFVTRIETSLMGFLHDCYPYPTEGFSPRILNNYNRITLVSQDLSERVTLDFELSYLHNSRQITLPNIVIVEVKTPCRRAKSPIRLLLRNMRIRPSSFSKYCIGVSLLCPDVKNNRFRSKLHQICKMMSSEGMVSA